MKKFSLLVALLGVFSYIAFPTTLQAVELSISGVSNRVSTCGNKKAGSISFQIQGGIGPYIVQLFKNNVLIVTLPPTQETSGTFPGLENGTYFIRVSDSASPKEQSNSSSIIVKNSCIPLLLYCCR